jgi:hypothetical protein
VKEGELTPERERRRYRWRSNVSGDGYIWDAREKRVLQSSEEARQIDPNEIIESDG